MANERIIESKKQEVEALAEKLKKADIVLLTDYRLIKNSLKMKGIGISRGYYLLHPFKFFEYIFVPYVIISTNIANELSVSCLCRGIDNDEKPSSYIELKFNKMDYLVITIVLGACCCIMFLR